MAKAKKFHLALYTMLPVTHHSMATWKDPHNMTRGFKFDRPEVWQYVGQLAERGCFDFFFSADTEGVYSEYKQSYKYSVKYAAQVPCFDQVTLLSFVAAHTTNIGFVATSSINGQPPFITARKMATWDHMTYGRAGWNVVTAFHKRAAENLGKHDQMDHDERYDMADEYMDVCYKLWDSWDADAVVQDVENDTFADPSKVHEIDHDGKYYKSRGPLNVHRSPQGKPLIVQAGQSSRGIAFAAKHAEAVFTIQPFVSGMKKYYDSLKSKMVELGRDPSECKVFFAFQPIVADTDEVAQKLADAHNSLLTVEAGMTILSGHLGYDLSKEDPNGSVENLKVPGIQGLIDIYKTPESKNITLAEIALLHARGVSGPQVVGSAKTIADWMEAAMEEVGGDGFLLSPIHLPSSLEAFVDLVVPELQRRGLMRTSYIPGATLRENLMAF